LRPPVAILHKGRLAQVGPPHEVITSENLRAIYGVDVEVWPVEAAATGSGFVSRHLHNLDRQSSPEIISYLRSCENTRFRLPFFDLRTGFLILSLVSGFQLN
jgi:hypothetical protein